MEAYLHAFSCTPRKIFGSKISFKILLIFPPVFPLKITNKARILPSIAMLSATMIRNPVVPLNLMDTVRAPFYILYNLVYSSYRRVFDPCCTIILGYVFDYELLSWHVDNILVCFAVATARWIVWNESCCACTDYSSWLLRSATIAFFSFFSFFLFSSFSCFLNFSLLH